MSSKLLQLDVSALTFYSALSQYERYLSLSRTIVLVRRISGLVDDTSSIA